MVQRCKFSIELKNFPPDLSGEPSLAVGGSYVLYGSQNKEELSDLALSNVEALTLGTKDCMYQRNSRCYELVVGPPGEPVIIETSEEANWVNRYTIPE